MPGLSLMCQKLSTKWWKVVKSGIFVNNSKTREIDQMLNFIGTYECKLDAKGRLLMPAALKKQLQSILGDGFVLKRSVFHKCLELYPMSEWDQVMAKVNKLNRFVKKNNDFIRLFTAGVKVIDIDANGRVLVPKDLISYSNLKKELVLSSSGNMIELWDKDAYEAVLNDPDLDFAALAEEVMGNDSNDLGNE
ncbi:MAG: MraZ protein [Flavobacteriales bacterium]|jgi:MraZ protein